jgi:quercetin dioxygenase-like cupin family protein
VAAKNRNNKQQITMKTLRIIVITITLTGAFSVLFSNKLNAQEMDKKNTALKKSTVFPLGEPVNPQWFTGEAWLQMISTENALNTVVANVTFAPGARNHWHSHKVGQVLLVTGGEGWYQEWGKPAQKLKEGDAVNIPANIKHWHGATSDSWFVHLALTSGESEWHEPVADEEYNSD